jgi:hypothetical protein
MPKAKPTPLSDNLLPIAKGPALPTPEPGRQRREPVEDRVSMTFRLRREDHDYLRRLAFETRRPQQSFVDDALKLLRDHGSKLAHASMEA